METQGWWQSEVDRWQVVRPASSGAPERARRSTGMDGRESNAFATFLSQSQVLFACGVLRVSQLKLRVVLQKPKFTHAFV
jgi:hypothetical protein|eukprot:COSAG02_NODE_1884_length_10516_cov_4.173466_8_plen_80_part_00